MSKNVKQSDTDTNNKIPYKYIDADNKVYQEPILKNDKGEISEDISNDHSTISKKNKNKKKNVNVENLSEEEIKNLIDEKTESIRQLGKKTTNLQKKLQKSLKQLNDKIQEGAEILYKKEINSNELDWLKEKLNTKQNLLNTEKKINHSYKVQYKILENKLKNRKIMKDSKKILDNDSNTNISQTINKTQSTKSLLKVNKSVTVSNNLYMNIEDEIQMIKNKNKEMIAEITKIKKEKVSKQKKVDDIISGELESQLRLKMEELQQFNMMKMDCKDRYSTLDKSMNMAKEKIKHFEEKAKSLEGKNEIINSDKLESYNFWMDLIKNEINNNTQEDLIKLIKNDESEFLKEVNKSRQIKKKKKLLRDASTEMIKENNNNEEKKVNPNKNIYAIFSLLNNSLKNNNENINNENLEIEKILQDENIFNLISENEYRELLNKKQEYIETSMRLEKTIESLIKTENSKYSKISKAIKEKLVQLKLVKEKNELIKGEINNLENIYQLSLEKENIKREINQKMNIKRNKNIIEKNENNKKLNDNNKVNDKNDNKNKHKIKNIGNKLKNDNSEEVTNKEDDFPDTRDEQLKVIRKKYMEEEDNSNFNNENNDIENMENDDKNENDLNNIDLNEDNKEFEQNEFKSEPPAPFKV
jgi:hypothetical protein